MSETNTYSIWVTDSGGTHQDGKAIPNCDEGHARLIAGEVYRATMSKRSRSRHEEINPETWPFNVSIKRDGKHVAVFNGKTWKPEAIQGGQS